VTPAAAAPFLVAVMAGIAVLVVSPRLRPGAAAILLIGMWVVSNGGFASLNPSPAEKAAEAQAFDEPVTPPTADAPTTSTGEPTNPPTGAAPNVNAPTTSAPAS